MCDGELVRIVPSGGAWAKEQQSLSGTGVYSQAACIKLKNSAGNVIPFAVGDHTLLRQAEYTHTDSHLNSDTLIPRSSGICALAGIAGRLSGGAEYAELVAGADWTFNVNSARGKESQGGTNGVNARATCGYY